MRITAERVAALITLVACAWLAASAVVVLVFLVMLAGQP